MIYDRPFICVVDEEIYIIIFYILDYNSFQTIITINIQLMYISVFQSLKFVFLIPSCGFYSSICLRPYDYILQFQ